MKLPKTLPYVNESYVLRDLAIINKLVEKPILVHYIKGIKSYKFGQYFETILVSTINGIVFKPQSNRFNVFVCDITKNISLEYKHLNNVLIYTIE